MLKNELKVALAILGTVFVPVFAQADASMNSSMNSSQQLPGLTPGDIVQPGQLNAGYPASAAYMCEDGWDINLGAKYIYWKWGQDSMLAGALVDQTAGVTNGYNGTTRDVVQSPGYTSGFKVGAGLGLQYWDDVTWSSEYTWYKNTDKQSVTGTAARAFLPRGVSNNATGYLVGTANTESHIGYQTLDSSLIRTFYLGKNVVADLGLGLRAQWISQHFSGSGSFAAAVGNTDDVIVNSVYRSMTSWQLGPNFILNTKWLLGAGFSILGNVHTSMLYTSYNTSGTASGTVDGAVFSATNDGLHNYGAIKPVSEFFLGLGWGMFFCDNSFHIDLAVGYDFNIYWNYNLMNAATQGPGDMSLQGLDISLRFDF